MSNHAQTILHEISLLEEPTDTPKLKFSVQKTSWHKNNSTFFIIKMKQFSIDHNSSSVGTWPIVVFQNVVWWYHARQLLENMKMSEIKNTRWVPTKWVSTLTSTHKSCQLLTKNVRLWESCAKLNFTRLYIDLKKLVQKCRKISTKVKTEIDVARREKLFSKKTQCSTSGQC